MPLATAAESIARIHQRQQAAPRYRETQSYEERCLDQWQRYRVLIAASQVTIVRQQLPPEDPGLVFTNPPAHDTYTYEVDRVRRDRCPTQQAQLQPLPVGWEMYVPWPHPLRFMETARHRQGYGAARTKLVRIIDSYSFVSNPDLAGSDDWGTVPPRRKVIYPQSRFHGRLPKEKSEITCLCCHKVFFARQGTQCCSPKCRKRKSRRRKVSRESVDFSTNSEKDTQLVVLALAERGLGEFEIAKELKLTRRQVQTLLWQAGKMMLVGMEVPAKENT